MSKRGQVTAFVIVSLVVLIVVAGVVYSEWDYLEENLFSQLGWFGQVPEEVKPINNHIIDCMEQTAEIVLPYNSWQSGYYDLGKNINPNNVSYYLYKGVTVMPSVSFLEKELVKGMEKNLEFCLELESFSDFNIQVGEIEFDVDIDEDVVTFDLDYHLRIVKGEEIFNLKSYRYVMPVRYGEIFEAVKKSVELQKEDVEDLCLTCLLEVAEEYDLLVEYYNPSDYEIEIVLIDESSVIDDRELMFVYGVRFQE